MMGVDLFAGAGGMSLGAVYAGIDVRLAVDIDKQATATYAHNHRDTKVLVKDVRDVVVSDLPDAEGPTILFGGPPCQGFSTSNQRTRNTSNTNNWLFAEFLRITRIWQPSWVVFENVKGIVDTEGGMFLAEVKAGFEKQGYTLTEWILNAADFGIPQRRSRYFLIGSRDGIQVPEPLPTTDKPITVGEAIGDLPALTNGALKEQLPYRSKAGSNYASVLRNGSKYSLNNLVTRNSALVLERYKHIPQGGNWQNIPQELMGNYADASRCHTGIYHRLMRIKESVVLGNYRKNMLIHPTQNRGLYVREAARLQSFPDSFIFKCPLGYQQQQVGNAEPPFMARMVFSAIRSHRQTVG